MSGFFNSLKNLASGTANVKTSIKYEAKDDEEDKQIKMPINISPLPIENSFTQWLDAMKMVARLSEGVPDEFRKKLWLMLADRHLEQRGIDWEQAEKICLNEWISADDEEFNAQIVKVRSAFQLFIYACRKKKTHTITYIETNITMRLPDLNIGKINSSM
ncbi:TBC1 domain family member 30-like [Cotesia glomerata]|uniref:Uncharacterized protein n=1 Tax=Cotesia glomerata TaxID=32391 RepID=A0AAV7IFE6_COTGL|nr:TBC1 domain family member 30-like [Cotesia glomerata]XP_044579251.1 TBC1 domain family member 30-like [Cotesia glomerata]KAH0549832.1 hypothetical protein KQX54_014859 [Cotesia glomerata]